MWRMSAAVPMTAAKGSWIMKRALAAITTRSPASATTEAIEAATPSM